MVSLTSRRALVCSALLSAPQVSGCTSWRTEPVAPAQVVQRKPELVRVTRSDSSRLILRDAEVRGDTLYGSPQDSPGDAKGRVGMPLADVASVETRRGDPNKTVLLGAGVAVGTFAALCLLADELGCADQPAFLVDLGRVK